jgi:hypothetical protein
MILEIKRLKVLNNTVAFTVRRGTSDETFEKITVDDKEIDLSSVNELNSVIDILKESIKNDLDVSTFSETDNALFSIFGLSEYAEKLSKLYEKNKENTNTIINVIENMISKLHNTKCCEECCTCVDDKYCSACQEAEKAAEAVEAVSNTRTFHWAQKYMDTVIDPSSELTGPEYNTLLAMFTQYGEWILKQ